MSKKGGYVIVDLKGQSITAGTPFTLDGVTARLNRTKNKACLLSGFAIGNEEKRDVFVDLQKTEDGYVGTVGEYQITIEDDEVTFVVHDAEVLLDNIVDNQGRKRFVEGDLRPDTFEGITYNYAKWSLSGTHLMFVLAGKIAAGTTTPANTRLAVTNLPSSLSFIHEKLVPISQGGGVVAVKSFMASNSNNWASEVKTWDGITLGKSSGLSIAILTSGTTITATTELSFRIEYDFLIDTAE